MGQITKRSYKLSDGRDIIYFDDADTVLPPDRGDDLREPAVRPPTATMRQDVLTGEWISIAAARQNRVVLPPSHLDPLAPASPENPSEIPSLYDVAVFENKSPSFGPDLAGAAAPEAWTTSPGGAGAQPAVRGPVRSGVLLPRTHRLPGGAAPVPDAHGGGGVGGPDGRAVRAARRRTGFSVREPRRGDRRDAAPPARADLRLPLHHAPHGPAGPHDRELRRPPVRGHPRASSRNPSGCCSRASTGRRLSRLPRAGRWKCTCSRTGTSRTSPPRPTRNATSSPAVPGSCAASTPSTTRPTPYISAWHQAPVHAHRDDIRLMLQLTSPRREEDKLKYLAGSEAAMGAFIADIPPETAAARLREAMERKASTTDRTQQERPRQTPRPAPSLSQFGQRAGRPVVGARAGQPDRRAHGLQRRLRVSDRDRQAHHGGGPRRADRLLRVTSSSFPGVVEVEPRRPGSRMPSTGWAAYPLGVAWAMSAAAAPASRHPGWTGADLGCPGRRRAVLLRRRRMRGGPGPERSLGARAGPAGTGPDRPAGREQGGRRTHRHHGPVGLAPGRAGPRHPAGLPEPVPRPSPSASPVPGWGSS